VGERLVELAEHFRGLAGGKRGAERARHELEQAGAGFERAAEPLVRDLTEEEARLERAREDREPAHRREKGIER